MPIEIWTALSAAIASFLSGLLGIGGAIVLAPLLLYGPGAVGAAALPVKAVTGLTVVQAISGSLLGSWRHHGYGHVAWRLVWLMGPTSAAASLAGALLSGITPDRLLLAIFAAFALLGSASLLMPERDPGRTVGELEVSVAMAVGIALVLGFFGGMVGIAAIAFFIAALVFLLHVPVRIAIGTSLAIGMFPAVATFIGKAATSQIDPPLALVVFAGALVASPIGAALSRRTRPRVLLLLLAAVVALSGVRMAWHAITGV